MKKEKEQKKKNSPDHLYAQINSIPSPALTLLKPKNNLKEGEGRGVKRVDEVREHQRHEHQYVCNPLVNRSPWRQNVKQLHQYKETVQKRNNAQIPKTQKIKSITTSQRRVKRKYSSTTTLKEKWNEDNVQGFRSKRKKAYESGYSFYHRWQGQELETATHLRPGKQWQTVDQRSPPLA